MSLFKKPSENIGFPFYLALLSPLLLIILYFLPGNESNGNTSSKYKDFEKGEFSKVNFDLDLIPPACEPSNQISNDISTLKIKIPKSRQWSKNIIQAYTSKSHIISEKNRIRFKSILFLNNSQCPLKGSLRISGDGKDHLDMLDGVLVSSLDVKLKDDNIAGVTKFKLFLPRTRNSVNEVVTANLFSYLGLLAPRTSLVMVDINNVNVPYIFQEKAEKEFLELNKRRESSMYKFDESLMWPLRAKHEPLSFGAVISPVVINNKWAIRNGMTSIITNTGLNKLSNEFNNVHHGLIHKSPPLSEQKLSGDSDRSHQIQSFFSVLSIITRSTHGLINHNRRFYYNPFNNQLEPIYYDGNSRYQSLEKRPLAESFVEYLNDDHFLNILRENKYFIDVSFAQEMLDSLDISEFKLILNRNGVILDIQSIADLKNELLSNFALLKDAIANSNVQEKNNKGNTHAAHSDLEVGKEIVNELKIGKVFLLERNKVIACHPVIEKCFKFNADANELRDIYNGGFTKDSLKYKYSSLALDVNNSHSSTVIKPHKSDFNEIKYSEFKLRVYGSPIVKVDNINKTMHFNLDDPRDKIVIYDGNINGWKIAGVSRVANDLESLDVRFDDQLLTSSLTIQDSTVNNLHLEFNGGLLEDSINLVRVNGNVSSVNVTNSFQDALDIDFSNLTIDTVTINNAGNDCVDFSSGNYTVLQSTLIGCADKGISIGEQSESIFNTVFVQNTNIAFVAKDSSNLVINDANVIDSALCVAAYRKKQEFAGATITIPGDMCEKENIFIQKNSQIFLK